VVKFDGIGGAVMANFKFASILMVLFVFVPTNLSFGRQSSFSPGYFLDSNYSIYYRPGHFDRYRSSAWQSNRYGYYTPRSTDFSGSGYRSSYYYYGQPRYRTRVDVTIRHGGGFYVHGPIPPVVASKRTPKPFVLEHGRGFETREVFLIDTVRRDTKRARQLAAAELAQYKQITSIAALIDVLVNDRSDKVRVTAARSLGAIGLPIANEALLRIVESEHSQQVAKAAKTAIEEIKANSATDPPENAQVPLRQFGAQKLAYHIEDVRYGSAEVRQEAVKNMKDYRDTRAVAALICILINDKDKFVRKEAAKSLGKIGDEMAVRFLAAASENDIDLSARKEADKAIKKINKS